MDEEPEETVPNMEEEVEETVRIPQFLNAEAFIEARFKELYSLTNLMTKKNRVTSIFQRLPKRMRRRAMSHSVKRVPKNLRDAHKRQLLKNKALQKTKSKRKLHRKRSKQLLLEYNRRQKNKLWLETHIWHAKRFRMVAKWGYKLASESYEKTFKASYRAMKSNCLLQDISFYGCIEITGFVDNITDRIGTMTSPECGLSIGAKCWLRGNREGRLKLFHSSRYPHDVIGPVTFMWKPSTEVCRTLWLWSHPAFYDEVLSELVSVFKLKPVICDDIEMEIKPVRKTTAIINLKNVPFSKVERYSNSDTNVVIFSLKDTLNRFRLCGPLSNSVLCKGLHPAELFSTVLGITDELIGKREERCSLSTFELLDKFSTPSQFPSHVILGSSIIDPRLHLKRQREKAMPSNEENEYCLSLPYSTSESMIWDSTIRDQASLTKISTAKINQLRSELLVSGFDEHLLKIVNTVIPILLVQNPGSNNSNVKLGFGSGWDIIVPANWAMPVWLSLILCGARPGGLRETKTLEFETQRIPELFPDSKAGVLHYDNIEKDCRDLYFRKPPNKRLNFIKHGIQTPFHYPWQALVEEWSQSKHMHPYFVFRNRVELLKISAYIDDCAKPRAKFIAPNFSFPSGSLIAVRVTLVSSGALTPFSHICLPTEEDLRGRMASKKLLLGPCEPIHLDVNRKKRKQLREAHTKLLKRLRRRRINEKKLRIASGLPARITKRKTSPTAQQVDEYLQTIQKLWVASETALQLRKHCERQICGFVTMNGFSYMQSCTVGLGYVTNESFSLLLDLQARLRCQLMVLTRAPSSLCYRFCTINVVPV